MKKRFQTLLENVQATLAELEAVHTVFGVETTTAATEQIYLFGCKEDGTQNPPRIILDVDGGNLRWNGGQFTGSVPVLMLLEFAIPEDYQASETAQAVWFWGHLEDILDELEDSVNGGGQLSAKSLDLVLPPGPIVPDDIPAEQTNDCVWITQLRTEIET